MIIKLRTKKKHKNLKSKECREELLIKLIKNNLIKKRLNFKKMNFQIGVV